MDLQIIETDRSVPKLTITPTRITIKYPIGFPMDDRGRIEKLARHIFETNEIKKSWRGTIRDFGVSLQSDSGKEHLRFNFI
jgi:hypothetical protein